MKSAYQKLRDLAFALWDVGAVLTSASDHPLVIERNGPDGKERGFKLKLHEKDPSAPLSPLYLNFRTPDNSRPGPLSPGIVNLAAGCLYGVAAEAGIMFDTVVGVPSAGTPFAKAFAASPRLASVSYLPMEKTEGSQGTPPGMQLRASVLLQERTLLVDDVITNAGAKIAAIDVLRNEGTTVTDVVVLVDREQGGCEELVKCGCRLHAVFTITDLLDLYVGAGRMEPRLRADIQTYFAAQV